MKITLLEASSIARAAQTTANKGLEPPSPGFTCSTRAIGISVYESQWRCSRTCMCTCHDRQNKNTPRLVNRFLGMIFIGYNGFPLISPPCDTYPCIRRPTAVVSYFFPPWLIARAFLLVMKLSLYDGPQLSIRVPRVISGGSKLFHSARIGDVNSIKEILQQRTGSPFDMDYATGFTALMVCSTIQT